LKHNDVVWATKSSVSDQPLWSMRNFSHLKVVAVHPRDQIRLRKRQIGVALKGGESVQWTRETAHRRLG
jgi:hypothetical protein